MDPRLKQISLPGVRRIAVYGPESSGKSTLARQLADHFHARLVEEYARPYIREKLRRTGENCGLEDIMAIAIGQQALENEAARETPGGLLICDTDLLTIKAYSEFFFGAVPAALDEALRSHRYDLYLLTDIDVPWVADGIRDRPQHRDLMLAHFERLLRIAQHPFVKLSGDPERRLKRAIGAISERLTVEGVRT